MNKEIQNKNTSSEGRELDLVELLRKLWLKRKFIFKVTGCFILFGLLVYFTSRKEYTASCEVVPQTNKNMSNNNMMRLASLAGINMGSLQGEQLISPQVYPNVLKNLALQRELLQTTITLKNESQPVPLIEYLTDKKYKKLSVMGALIKYTIGLPIVIIHAIKGEPGDEETGVPMNDDEIIVLTHDERKAVKRLKNIVSMQIDEKKGYLTITARMPEPYAAAQIAENTIKLLQKYITEFKIDKVQSTLEFMQGRYDVLKKEYEDIQTARARFKDANQNTISYRTKIEVEKYDNEYNLAYSVFAEVAAQLEQAKIQVKENTPIMTVISPVALPIKPSKPRGMVLLVGFTFLGLLFSCGYVLFSPIVRDTFNSFRSEEKKMKAGKEDTSSAD